MAKPRLAGRPRAARRATTAHHANKLRRPKTPLFNPAGGGRWVRRVVWLCRGGCCPRVVGAGKVGAGANMGLHVLGKKYKSNDAGVFRPVVWKNEERGVRWSDESVRMIQQPYHIAGSMIEKVEKIEEIEEIKEIEEIEEIEELLDCP